MMLQDLSLRTKSISVPPGRSRYIFARGRRKTLEPTESLSCHFERRPPVLSGRCIEKCSLKIFSPIVPDTHAVRDYKKKTAKITRTDKHLIPFYSVTNMFNIMKLTILFLLFYFTTPAQVPAKEAATETVFIDPELMPQFKGGNSALMHYLQDSVKNKVSVSLDESYILKPAYAKFSISESGKVSNVRIVRSSNIPHVDSLFKSAIEKMPDWIPGAFDGKPKRAEMNLPLRLELK